MTTLFKNYSPKPFGNANLAPKSNYGRVPSFTFHGLQPGQQPPVNTVNTVQPFGNPKVSVLGRIPSLLQLIHG